MKIFISVILSFILLNTLSIRCQDVELSFNYLTQEQGLSQSTVSFIYQDSYGFVWLSSIDGLNRFDATNVKVYRSMIGDSTSIYGGNIQSSFFEDKEGNLWFTTYKGINCYRRKTDDFRHFFINNEKGEPIKAGYHAFHLDESDQLWVKVNGRLYFFNTYANSTKNVGALTGLRCKLGQTGRVTGRNMSILSYFKNNGVGFVEYKIDSKGDISEVGRYFDGANGLLEKGVHDIHQLSESEFIIATNSELLLFNKELAITDSIRYFEGKEINKLRGIVPLNKNQYFVSSGQGLLLFDWEKKAYVKHFGKNRMGLHNLPPEAIDELYLDKYDNLWVSIWGKGVAYANIRKVKFDKFKLYQPSGPQEGQLFIPSALGEDYRGNLWCGSSTNGLIVLDEGLNIIPSYYRLDLRVKQIFREDNGRMWVLPWSDYVEMFDTLDYESQSISLPNIQYGVPGSMVQLSDKRLLLSRYISNGILEIISSDSGVSIDSIKHPYILSHRFDLMYQAADGTIYLSEAERALAIFSYKNQEFKHDTTLEVGGEIKCFQEDSQGNLWIGGTFGLAQLNQKTKTLNYFREEEGLKSPYVYGILIDQNELLWVSTNSGLFTYHIEKCEFVQYTPMDGLQDYEFNSNSFLKRRDGTFWFGGVNGYNVFVPEAINSVLNEPEVNITDIRINQTERPKEINISLVQNLELKHSENTLSFRFVSSEYSDPKRNKLKYKLEKRNKPFDKRDWVEVYNYQGFAHYPKLKHGKYIFHVLGTNSDGKWEKDGKKINITINPPFWKTTWFWTIVTLALLALTWISISYYLAHQLRIKNLTIREQRIHIEKQEALQRERNRVASEMHDDLGGGLTSIRLLIKKAQKPSEEYQHHLLKIENYTTELIENMREIIWAMNSGHDSLADLIAYLRLYVMNFFEISDIHCVIHIPPDLPELMISGEKRRNIFLCVKEGIHNIVKHANATEVKLSFILEKDLVIELRDNGVGFKSHKEDHFGNGLINMRERMTRIDGKMKIIRKNGTFILFRIPISSLTTLK